MKNQVQGIGRDQIEQMWHAYKSTGEGELRDRLLEHYLPLVHHHARRVGRHLPSMVDEDDLYGAGTIGLIDAVHAFDPQRGVKFETFCARRVRGAIVDELRSLDWASRLARTRAAGVEKAHGDLVMRFGRPPSDAEIAVRLGLRGPALDRMLRDSRVPGVRSLEQPAFSNGVGEPVRIADTLASKAEDSSSGTRCRTTCRQLIAGLERRDRLIIQLHYFEKMTMRDVGEALDISESRVSQLHGSILARLRADEPRVPRLRVA
jgi:RNA polymerase sigma factor for flagellar operon FliA